MVLVVHTNPDPADEFWDTVGPSASNLADSGLGLSLHQSPITWNGSPDREPGEILDTEESADEGICKREVKSVVQSVYDWDNDLEFRNNKWKFWVPRSWEERMVLQDPPAPVVFPVLRPPPMEATLITDRVGAHLTHKDQTLFMQNDVAEDFWQLARLISLRKVEVDFKYVLIQLGIDWCLKAKKAMVIESIKRLAFGIQKMDRHARIGILGITPRFSQMVETKKFTVTYNRNLAAAVKACQDRFYIQFIPIHLHFIDEEGDVIQPTHKYFNREDEYTIAGGFVLRQMLFKEMKIIPLSDQF